MATSDATTATSSAGERSTKNKSSASAVSSTTTKPQKTALSLLSETESSRLETTLPVRTLQAGNVHCKVSAEGNLAALFRSNYVSSDLDQIIVVRRDGDVIGYNTSWDFLNKKKNKPVKLASLEADKLGLPNIAEENDGEEELNDLLQRRNILMDKLASASAAQSKPTGPQRKLIAADTNIHSSIKFNFEAGYPELILSTKNATMVHGVVAHSSQLFEREVVSQ